MDLSFRPELRPELRTEPPSRERRPTVSVLHEPELRKLRLEELCFTDLIDEKFLVESGYLLSSNPPIVASVGNLYVILDGNHRCAYDLLMKDQETVVCAIWKEDPPVTVLKCESGLLQEVIQFGVERAVKVHQEVIGRSRGIAPGLIDFR